MKAKGNTTRRKSLALSTRAIVLAEAGYRCAVPTCRNILALDLHHMVEVSDGGGDDPSNLVALCPTCHALHHRGTIPAEAIYLYKSILVGLTQAFDIEAIDRLLFLSAFPDPVVVSGDGLLHFGRLIASGLVTAKLKANNNGQLVTYSVGLEDKGRMLIDGWKAGDRDRVRAALGDR